MGIIKRGILGGFKNKVGVVVGSNWKGISTMRALPEGVANPQTAGQVNQRTKFAACSQYASIILVSMIKPLMDRFAVQKSGYNEFVQINIEQFDGGALSSLDTLDFGPGKLGDTPIVTCTPDVSADEVTITWDASLNNQFKLDTDIAYVMVLDTNTKLPIYQGETPATRIAGTVTVAVEGTIEPAQTYGVYLIFKRADGTLKGNTFGGAYVSVA